MVRKYNPEIKKTWYPYDGEPDVDAVMRECVDGGYVKLQTYNDATAQLRAQIDRLTVQLEEALGYGKGMC